jgi:hypothetical protein
MTHAVLLRAVLPVESAPDIHRISPSGMRGAARRGAAVQQRASSLSRRRQPTKGHYSSFELAEDGVGGNETRIPADCVGIRHMIAEILHGAVYDFRESVRKAVWERRGTESEAEALPVAERIARRSYAGRWMFGNDTQPFGFVWCCSVLALDPDRVRRALLERLTCRRRYSVKTGEHASHVRT